MSSEPTRDTATMRPAPAATREPAGQPRAGRPRAARTRPASSSSSVAIPAAIASGWPDSVPAWYIGPVGRDERHQVAPAAVCADRHPAADDLAEHGEVRPHAEARLRAARSRRRNPVMTSSKIEQRAVGARQLAERLEEAGLRRRSTPTLAAPARRSPPRSGRRARRTRSSPRTRSLNGSTIVCAATAAGTPALPGIASVATPEPASTSSPSRVAVIAAGELDDQVAPGRGARQAHGAHGGLGARTT